MTHPKNGKGVGPGGNECELLQDFLFKNTPTHMTMSMETMRMIASDMVTDVEEIVFRNANWKHVKEGFYIVQEV